MPKEDRPGLDHWRISNKGLIVFASLMIGVAAVGVLAALLWLAHEKPGVGLAAVVAAYALFFGWFLGGIHFSVLRGRTVTIKWTPDEFAIHLGWAERMVCRCAWDDPIRACLFVGPSGLASKGPFLLQVELPTGTLRVDAIQMRWRSLARFVDALEAHVRIKESPIQKGTINQGSSWTPSIPST